MAAEEVTSYLWEVCRGTDQPLPMQYTDGYGLGIELAGFYTLSATFATTPDPAATPVLTLGEIANANGSIVEEVAPSILGPTTITSVDEVAGTFTVTGAGYQVSQPNVPRDDETGAPSTPTLLTLDVVEPGDVARVVGAPANNADWTVKAVVDSDNVTVLEALAASAGGGTLEILRFGQIRLLLDALETSTLPSGTVWYGKVVATEDATGIGHCVTELEIRFT